LLVEGRRPLSEENKKTKNGFPDLKVTIEHVREQQKRERSGHLDLPVRAGQDC
jgi:hypothetical protein